MPPARWFKVHVEANGHHRMASHILADGPREGHPWKSDWHNGASCPGEKITLIETGE